MDTVEAVAVQTREVTAADAEAEEVADGETVEGGGGVEVIEEKKEPRWL